MAIVMTNDFLGATDDTGSKTRVYKTGEELPNDEFGKKLGQIFIDAGVARETKVVAPTETKATGKRARNDKGQLLADDPATPNFNEAWEGGVAPKK